jgi:hypothetical protein
MRHFHTREDEFVFVVEGEVVLVTDEGEQALTAGTCGDFPAGARNGHHLVNRSDRPARYLEISNRDPEDTAEYSDEDLAYRRAPDGPYYGHQLAMPASGWTLPSASSDEVPKRWRSPENALGATYEVDSSLIWGPPGLEDSKARGGSGPSGAPEVVGNDGCAGALCELDHVFFQPFRFVMAA